MKEIIFLGRGGMGVKSAAHLLAIACFYEGKDIKAFPEYGPERRGAPVRAFVKVSENKIFSYETIIKADYLVVLDPSLPYNPSDFLKEEGILLINGEGNNEKNKYFINGTQISLKICNKNFANVVLIGGLAKISKLASLENLKRAIHETFKHKGEEIVSLNYKLLEEGYNSL